MRDIIRHNKSIFVDTDASGINDDAIALHLLFSSGVNVEGISCVFGNLSPAESSIHVREIADKYLLSPSIEVGSDRPLRWAESDRNDLKSLLESVDPPPHLGSLDLRNGSVWSSGDGSRGLALQSKLVSLLERGGLSDVLCLGPLTNVAHAIRYVRSDALSRTRLWVAGGSLGAGNVGPYAEFNLLCDPDAANVVLAGSWREIVVVPIEVSGRARLTLDRVNQLATGGTNLGKDLNDLERDFPRGADKSREPIWDAVATLLCLSALPYAVRRCRVIVEQRGERRGELTDSRSGALVSIVTDLDPTAALDSLVRVLDGWNSHEC